ncbi:hypothetical protein [Pedobacter glucosidilyticus]|uniref:hypothetical protein n=1 Tax=Pedobacter glucosidilyticus TaxID=1122941 RepID=UPI000429FD1A|nr:hypothetical protein [Pedobacter glucosidilyticus]
MYAYLKQLLVVILILIDIKSFSQIQESYSQATLTFTNGKVEKGFIKDIELSKIDKDIKFKSSISDKKFLSLKPDSLLNEIKLESGEKYKVLSVKHPLTQDTLKVLAVVLLEGNLSLYESVYNESGIFIIQKQNQNYWLQNDELLANDTKVTSYRYKNTLFTQVSDSKVSFSEVELLTFNRKSMVEIVQKYNGEKGVQSDIRIKNKKPVIFLIAGGGVGYDIGNNSEYYFESRLRLFSPSISKSFSLNVGLRYHYFDNQLIDQNRKIIQVGSGLFELPIEIQNNFLSRKFRPFGTVGVSLSYLNLNFSKIPENYSSESAKQLAASVGGKDGFGANLIYSLGLEWNIINSLILRGMFINNRNGETILCGLKYNLKITK